MNSYLRPAAVTIVLFTGLTGIAYPLAMTGLAQALFPVRAGGNLLTRDDQVVGSSLIGQAFTSDRYFHGRPSAAGQNGYDASSSSGSNLGPISKKLLERVEADVGKLRGDGAASIPADAVTASASGLDPHISPAFAELQIARVAKARSVPEDRVRAILAAHTETASLSGIGEPRVNVLELNLALDAATATSSG